MDASKTAGNAVESDGVQDPDHDTSLSDDLETLDRAALIARIRGLEAEITGRHDRLAFELGERVKELTLLHETARLAAEPELALAEILAGFAEAIPPAWQWPDVTRGRITIGELVAESPGFVETPWRLEVPVTVDGAAAGAVTVCLLEERRDRDGRLFLAEESTLVETLALKVGRLAERRGIAHETAEHHRRVLAILDAFPEILYVADPTTYEVIYTNHVFTEMLGGNPVGKLCYKAFHGLDAPCDFCTNEQILANPDEPYTWHHHNELLDRDFQITDKLIQWPDGRMVRFEVALDVTGDEVNKRELLAEKSFSEAMMESMPGVCYLFDQQLRFHRWNRNFETVTGYSTDEIAELSPLDLFDDEDAGRVAERIGEVFGTGESLVEANFLAKDGSTTPFLFTGRMAEINGEGFLVGMGIDITDRAETEARLRESEERFRAIFEQAAVGVAQVHPSGRLMQINQRFCHIVDYDHEELLALTFQDITHPDDLERDLELFSRLSAGEIPSYSMEKRYLRRDGAEVWVELTASMVAKDDGSPSYFVAVVEDISDRRAAEAAVEAAVFELERSNRELEQFAYVASHDLQEPLRMVASYTQLLEKRYGDALDDDAHDFIGFAVDGANRMQRLIEDLLQYSRVTTRGSEPAPIDAHEALGEAVANLSTLIDETGAMVGNGNLPVVLADRSQLVRLFQNLIQNAIKFRAEAPPRIDIQARRDDGMWAFSVSDNGIGIEERHFERIFVIFQHLHPQSKYPGTGMGLALCRRIVERHGGTIRVESEPGAGTCFRFTLPATQEDLS